MTTFRSLNVTCAVCGTVSEQDHLTSTNTMGPPDLDTRPAPMQRNTLAHVIQQCPTCGFCAPDLSEAPAAAQSIVATAAYLAQLHDEAVPALARTYRCWALICEGTREYHRAGWAALTAAWVCDDAAFQDNANAQRTDTTFDPETNANMAAARACRRHAIAFFLTAREYEQTFMQQEGGEELLLTDLYRRCVEFALAAQAAERGLTKANEEVITNILRGQLAFVARHDVDAHTVPEALALL